MRLTKADGYKKIGIGLGVIFVTLICLVWFYFSLYKNPVTSNIIFFVFLTVVAILISALSLLKLICMFAFLIIETGINETKYIRKYDRHTFDLRGNYPTIAFKEKIEEFWFKYNS